MFKHIQLVLLAITGLLQGCTGKETEKATTCSVSRGGTSGWITCHFNANLNVTKQDFSVRRSFLNGMHTDWILDCTWEASDRTKCFVGPSYTFNGKVSENAVIQILDVTDEDDKRYWCQVVPSENSIVETCSFQTPSQSLIPRTTTAKYETTMGGTDLNRASTGFQVVPWALLLGSLLLSLLLL